MGENTEVETMSAQAVLDPSQLSLRKKKRKKKIKLSLKMHADISTNPHRELHIRVKTQTAPNRAIVSTHRFTILPWPIRPQYQIKGLPLGRVNRASYI